jgi:hypothetical protein
VTGAIKMIAEARAGRSSSGQAIGTSEAERSQHEGGRAARRRIQGTREAGNTLIIRPT